MVSNFEDFEIYEPQQLPEREEDEEEPEIKIDESILNIWELWKIAKDQNENELRSEAFEELKNCWGNLSLRDMSVSIVPNIFPNGLNELDLGFNKLTKIPDNLPETLEILNMDCNLISIIPEKLPSNLRELIMSRNKINDIPETLPDSLTRIYFYDNAIKTLPNKLPKNLKRLNVSNNQLSCLPESLPDSIEVLEVSYNHLTTLPNNLPMSLRSIHLDHNKIKKFPETLPEMLKEIRIRNNDLVSLPKRLPKSLTNLYLSNNPLAKPKFDYESIIELELINNGIENICEEDFNLPKLQKLFISDNKLTSLPRNLPETLECLNVSGNKLSKIEIDLPKSLKYLILDENNINTLSIKLPSQLERLSLSGNKFTEIPKELPESLDSLSLSNNLITEVSTHIENIPNTTIYLEGNPLSETSLEYLRYLIRTTGNITVWFGSSYEYYANFVNTHPLIEEIANWLDIELIHQYWSNVSDEIITRPFSRLLHQMRETPNFEIEQFKLDMSKWLYSLGEDNNSIRKLREKIFLIAAEANGSCHHRAIWFMNQIKILSIAQEVESGKYDNQIEELIKLARGMYRLNIIDQISRQTVRNLEDAGDETEIYLEYQIRLRSVLDLPIITSKMNKDYAFVLSDEDIERAVTEILNKEQNEFVNYLLIDWHPWKEVLKRKSYEQFLKCESDIKNEDTFKQELDKRKREYILETNLVEELSLDVEIQLGSQIHRQIERDIWLKLTNEYLESIHLENIERLINFH